MILYFMRKHFADKDGLVVPKNDVSVNIDVEKMKKKFINDNYKDDYKILSQEVRELGENIPPLINAYMNLSPTMRTFGTVFNKTFGKVEETGIMITIKDIYIDKVNRHLASYRDDYEIGIGY